LVAWFDKADRQAVGIDIKTVEFGWPIGMPVCRPMGGGLYEVRTNLSSNRIARVLFGIEGNNMVLLHDGVTAWLYKENALVHRLMTYLKKRVTLLKSARWRLNVLSLGKLRRKWKTKRYQKHAWPS